MEGEGKGRSFAGWLGVERGGGGVDPPRRLAPEGDHHEGEGVRVAAAKTRAPPSEGERSENVDPTGVDVDAVGSLAPSPEGPDRVAWGGGCPGVAGPRERGCERISDGVEYARSSSEAAPRQR